MKQNYKKLIKDCIIEKTLHQLTHALTVGKKNAKCGTIDQTIQAYAFKI